MRGQSTLAYHLSDLLPNPDGGAISARRALQGITLVLALVLTPATPGLAQRPSYGPEVTYGTAKKVATAALAEAVKRKWPVAVAVVDSHGFLVY